MAFRRRRTIRRRRTFRKRFRPFRKRRMGFKRRGRKITTARIRGFSISDRLKIKLRYHDLIKVTTLFGGDLSYLFRGNSLFDPDQALGGHQPLGFDHWEMFYSYYYVRGSKMSIKIRSIATNAQKGTTDGQLRVFLIPYTTTVVPSGSLEEQKDVTYRTMQFPANTTGAPPTKIQLKKYMSTDKVVGQSTANEEDYVALVTADPPLPWYWHIIFRCLPPPAAVQYTILMDVDIVFYAEFRGKKILPTS